VIGHGWERRAQGPTALPPGCLLSCVTIRSGDEEVNAPIASRQRTSATLEKDPSVEGVG